MSSPMSVTDHIASICKEAGLEVMAELLGIVQDREELDDDAFTGLNSGDISEMYNSIVEPAVDRLARRLG